MWHALKVRLHPGRLPSFHDFRRNHELVPFAAHGFAEHAFPESPLLEIGGINEIDPLINAAVDHPARGGPLYWLAESNRTKTEAGNLKIRSFQSYLIHCSFVSPTASPSRGLQNLAIAKSNYLADRTCSVI